MLVAILADFCNFKLKLSPAGCSKIYRKFREFSVRPREFLVFWGGLQIVDLIFKQLNVAIDRH